MRPLAARASGLGEVSLGLLLPVVTVGLMFAANCGAPDVVRRAQPAGGSGGEFSSSSSEGTAGVAGSTASTPPKGGSSRPGSAGSYGGSGGTSVAGGGGAAGGASTTGGKGGTGGASATGGKGGTGGATGGKGGGGGAGGSSYIGASGITTSPFAGNGGAGDTPDTSAGGAGDTGGAGGTPSSSEAPPPPSGSVTADVLKVAAGSSGQMSLSLQINNTTLQPVDMSTVTLRYWYQDEGLGPVLAFEIDDARVGDNNAVTGKVHGAAVAAPSPVAGAGYYLELSFGAVTLSAKGTTGSNDKLKVTGRLHNSGYQGAVVVTNDYSYNDGKTGYDDKITLYGNGKLISGTEP